MGNTFDFILSKTQRDLYIAHWKKLHADKPQLETEDYILHAFLSPAAPDIGKKYNAGFVKAKNPSKTRELYQRIRRLRYCLRNNKALWDSVNIELDESQRLRLYELIGDTCNRSC